MYQKYRYGANNQDKKNKPRAGWDEDDHDNVKSGNFAWKGKDNKNFNFNDVKKSEDNYSSYKPPESKNVVSNMIPVEQKLIDDLIQPTGISVKPNATQLKDFVVRAKRLDREVIFKVIFEKIQELESFSNEVNAKTLIKCLYVVEALLQSGISDLFEWFSEHQEIFETLKENYQNNKKVIEVSGIIQHILNPNINANTTKQSTVVNLLGEEKSNNANLLDEITSNNSTLNNNTSTNNINIFNIFTSSNVTPIETKSNLLEENLFNNISTNNSNKEKSFGFIKKSNNNSSTQNKVDSIQNILGDLSLTNPSNVQSESISPQPKKGFSFIKSKEEQPKTESKVVIDNLLQSSTFNLPTNITSNIFNSFMPQVSVPTVDFTKSNVNPDDIFSKNNNVDVSKITNNYNQNFDPSSKPTQVDLDLIMGNHFNYNKVNEHIDTGKNNGQKDHFSFVNDMLKSKK